MISINPIPTPKKIEYSENSISFKIRAAKVFGKGGKILNHALSMLGAEICDEKAELVIYMGKEQFSDDLKKKTEKLFTEKFAKEQGYYLTLTERPLLLPLTASLAQLTES